MGNDLKNDSKNKLGEGRSTKKDINEKETEKNEQVLQGEGESNN